jgi:hypothetical protein
MRRLPRRAQPLPPHETHYLQLEGSDQTRPDQLGPWVGLGHAMKVTKMVINRC